MRIFSYRNKRRAWKLLLILSVAALLFLAFCLGRFIYIQRFLVYSNGSVKLDYEQDLQSFGPAKETPAYTDVSIEIVTEDPMIPVSSVEDTMKPLTGFYITTDMLRDLETVQTTLSQQEALSTIMLDLKSIYGNFYYDSSLPGAQTATADIAAIESLIQDLAQNETVYLIARIPAFSDSNFALDNQSCGLPLRSGALWMDENGCYWLDPLDETVQEYLVSIAQELALMGFDEIVFDQFMVPDSKNIVYDREFTREEAPAISAEAIRSALSTEPIRISFNSADPAVAAFTDRVYLTADNGSAVAGLVEGLQAQVTDPSSQIVFLTASRDTRFEGYGLLRPLIEPREE